MSETSYPLPAKSVARALAQRYTKENRSGTKALLEPPPTAPAAQPAFHNYLHSAIAIPLIYFYTIVMGGLSLLLSFVDHDGLKQHWCAKIWCRLIAATTRTKVRVHGIENIRPGVSYVFLSTHQSYMDIPAMLGFLPAQLRIAAKKSLFRIPFMGWHLARAGHIPIDRSSSERAVATMRRSASLIKNGTCAFVFPEGTRSTDGRVHEFKKGGFKLAIQARAPIIPITIIGSRQILPKDSIVFRPGTIDMFVDPPISTEDKTDDDIAELMLAVRAAMYSHLTMKNQPDSASKS
jgi:1-acyl-sn-glycerol-3-phosphate acyltransferase